MSIYTKTTLAFGILSEFYTPIGLLLGVLVSAMLTGFTWHNLWFIGAMLLYLLASLVCYRYIMHSTFKEGFGGYATVSSLKLAPRQFNLLHAFAPIWVAALSDFNVLYVVCTMLIIIADNMDGRCYGNGVLQLFGITLGIVRTEQDDEPRLMLFKESLGNRFSEGDVIQTKSISDNLSVLRKGGSL